MEDTRPSPIPSSYRPLYTDEGGNDFLKPPSKRLSRARIQKKLWAPVLIIALFGLFIILSISAIRFTEAGNQIESSSAVPKFKLTKKTFQETASFENLATEDEVSEAWGKYGLPSYGFINLPNPDDYGLPPNHDVVPGTQNTYMISVYHQLHCLKALHVALLPQTTGHVAHRRDKQAHGPSPDFEHNHLEHCLDYLRQAVMCSGDVTLEPPDEHPEKGKSPLQGLGVMHICRNWEGIESWRDENGVL